eukprot:jgi/Chlat1/4364/Chrsp29S04509
MNTSALTAPRALSAAGGAVCSSSSAATSCTLRIDPPASAAGLRARPVEGACLLRRSPTWCATARTRRIVTSAALLQEAPTRSSVAAVEQTLQQSFSHARTVPPPAPLLVVISGPSGVGKDAVIRRLQEARPELYFVVTATSRRKRHGEVHGRDYYFVTKDEFDQMIDKGELLEHAVVYGEYKGIPKRQVREAMVRGTDVVLRVDVQGASTVRSMVGDTAVFIFLVAESEAALVHRLVARKTETPDKLTLRVKTAQAETARLHEFDYVVVNSEGRIEETVSKVAAIIDAEKCRVHRRPFAL